MKSLLELEPFAKDHQINAIIETPKGSGSKMKYDPELELFSLHRVLPKGMAFPYDFGFIPSTMAEDGDPLDVLVLVDTEVFPGCLTKAKIIGVIKAKQKAGKKKSATTGL